MAKILISFLAFSNDIADEKVSLQSPNYNIHKYFYNYESHYLLYHDSSHYKKVYALKSFIEKNFPSHIIYPYFINIQDPINIVDIKEKLLIFLNEIKKNEIEIFISPGTPQMQIAWFLLHIAGVANTRLIQGRKSEFTKDKRDPEFFYLEIEKSAIPYNAVLKSVYTEEYLKKYPVGKSIQPLFNKARQIAQTRKVTTLIRGESGTGKELLAKYIHDNSDRRDKPFIHINCSSLSDDLLESRLFGHKKGSFTGAISDHDGLFLNANKGTIFLDEIGDISPKLQQSLLRVLQNDEILPIGSTKPVKIDVRVISATNKNLEDNCNEGKFRWDLYYRLNTVELELPSLRLRTKEELNDLIDYFINEKAVDFSKNKLLVSKNVRDFLLNYNFPGNIRELENIISNCYVFCEGKIEISDLPFRTRNTSRNLKNMSLESAITSHIQYVLDLNAGNKTKAAEQLDISVNTLKKYIM